MKRNRNISKEPDPNIKDPNLRGNGSSLDGIEDRLKAARKLAGKTQIEMEESLGLGRRSWQNYEGRGQIPGAKVLAGMVHLGLSANWILTGQGSMRQFHVPGPDEPAEDAVHIRAPGESNSIASLSFDAKWLEAQEIKDLNLTALLMPDDGMYPTIAPGGIVVIDTGRDTVDHLGIWVLKTSANTMVARAQPQPGDKVLLSHDNRLYQDMLVDVDLFTVIGKVIWIGTPV